MPRASIAASIALLLACALIANHTPAHDVVAAGVDYQTSQPGENAWNEGQPAPDWWEAIRNQHGHVGPWNVLGYRMGQRALTEFGTTWGRHDLDITFHTPMKMPFTCSADGLVVGTGNSIGRLDIRLAAVETTPEIRAVFRRTDGTGPLIIMRPAPSYWKALEGIGPENMDAIARKCSELSDEQLFEFDTSAPPKSPVE